MLTEIEWWGGLLFIWWALCYRMFLSGDLPRLSLDALINHCVFIFSAVLLALYFYPLASPAAQYGYLVGLGLALISLAMMFFWPEGDDDEPAASVEADVEEEEEIGAGYELMGQAIYCAPLVIACLLGVVKSYDVVRELGWLS